MEEIWVDRTLYQGRPEKEEGRLPKEVRTYDLLDRLRIPYWRVDHDVIPTIEACQEVDKLLGIQICKNLFLCNAKKTDFYLLLMPGEKQFKTKDLSKQIGSSRLSFGPGEFMEEFLDIQPGSVSVLGLMNDRENRVQLIIDRQVAQEEYLGCHPCINTSSLKLSMADVLEKFLPAVKHEPIFVDLP
ncbi:MAG: prolyl-tRNA synthetase associated domain-containing protein [Lachnospiraceae bacterium]|jgi:Ala-tRNA(Pro) deacylase|nr:prolyl-tRNA synthetase associated domain-containing protein [Lachnospiraceae bacterium]MCI8996021.1 prolyl-tRNA synthetase associated domain-containing protein [Lachnospiraceae bacterium]MCI9134850.1 prolyl-tRNA synthetase associated domain-containing protein [Lachnospiraceae bacterium]